ncbi:Calsenilin A-type potassium channel modulatory protein 3 DRE-antagonist modulator [Takifugu flavidus]|uniref:Calsenilin A-type potassium channel modulatory protein 3 DRE-antagonist modulator n=1 Tax=Takifugu flavidus TaxID=433684 RepID=A0A5C6N2S4_9TELE|nr:Calsenilin A-type potassium channel modulatory protein 3 DRE-antagonist modulator [Takifugu flavidus]
MCIDPEASGENSIPGTEQCFRVALRLECWKSASNEAGGKFVHKEDGPRDKTIEVDGKVADGLLGDANGVEPPPGRVKDSVKWQKPRFSRKALMKCCLVRWIIASTQPQDKGSCGGTFREQVVDLWRMNACKVECRTEIAKLLRCVFGFITGTPGQEGSTVISFLQLSHPFFIMSCLGSSCYR